MTKEFISPEGVFKARGYVHTAKAGNTIYVAGQGGYDPDGNIVKGDFSAQAHQAFENMKRVLEAAGATMQDVVKLNYYFANLAEDASKVGDAYRKYFGKHLVAATAIQVTLAYPEMLLEVEAVAVMD